MTNLIAYIPAITQDYIDWVGKHRQHRIWLVSKSDAASILPRLGRDMRALEAHTVLSILRGRFPGLDVRVACFCNPLIRNGRDFILPDEDISHEIVERFLSKLPGVKVSYENKFLRWDMTAVKRQEPIIPDVEVSTEEIDIFRIEETEKLSRRSPDWWRQIGAMAWRGSELLACGWNRHFPTEYETLIFGDTRLNFDAGDPAGMDAYLSLHAEEYIISFCAANGIALNGASMYINTFPCGRCARAVSISGIKELFFREGCSFLKGFEILRGAGVRVVHVKKDPVEL